MGGLTLKKSYYSYTKKISDNKQTFFLHKKGPERIVRDLFM